MYGEVVGKETDIAVAATSRYYPRTSLLRLRKTINCNQVYLKDAPTDKCICKCYQNFQATSSVLKGDSPGTPPSTS
jgi:hypothetical protein